MPNRALASAFGGIADFLKLQRGLQNETADRKQAAERHGLNLALGKGQERLLNIQGTRGEFENKNLGRDDARKTADWLKGYGPSTLTPEVTRGLFGTENPGIAEGLNASIAKQIAREGQGDKLLGEQVTQAQLGTQEKQDVRNARDEIKNIPGYDPQMNAQHAFTAIKAGYPGASAPIYGQIREDKQTDRDFTAEQNRLARNAAVGLARMNINANSLNGSNQAMDNEIKTQMAPLIQASNSIQANIQADELKIAQLQAQKDANVKQFNIQGALPANNLLDRQIARIRNAQIVKAGQAYASGDGIRALFQNTLGGNPTVLSRVDALMGTAYAGLPPRPTPQQLEAAAKALETDPTPSADPSKKTPAGTNNKVNIVPR